MKTYLNVPYEEKEKVKKLGAKWDITKDLGRKFRRIKTIFEMDT